MRKRILASLLALTLIFSLSNGMSVNATEVQPKLENVLSDNSTQFEFMEMPEEELEATDIPEIQMNAADRSYHGGQIPLSDGVMTYNESEGVSNTDPNYAYLVENNMIFQGAIETEEEFRWYAFEVTEKSKVSILLQMVDTMDADLYLFLLDTETYTLNLFDGSAAAGLGVSEYYTNVLDPGIYYFAVVGYEGTGAFAFAFYQSSRDANYEINDSQSTATSVTMDTNMIGVIDSPYDIDYYKVSIASSCVMQYSISTSNGYSLLYAGCTGLYSKITPTGLGNNTVFVKPGTYYFAVLSENGTYSATSTYTVNFKNVGGLTNDSSANVIGISQSAGIVFQTNRTGSVYYVNGNPIDISYSYSDSRSNAEGSQSYSISLKSTDSTRAYLTEPVLAPSAIIYQESTRPAMKVSSRAALQLTFLGVDYQIHCLCTGAYAANNLWEDLGVVTVIIDPATGKLIDIDEFNYFYDYAVGSNYLSYSRPYPSMTLYIYEDIL